jgi:hypothetical protein
MKPISGFQYFCLARFGKPAQDRSIYKAIRNHKVQSIVEIGLGDGSRAETMLRVAKKFSITNGLRYTGVDLFEGREDEQSPLALREMHKRLSSSGAKVQLVPGDMGSSLSRIANSHVRTDLIVISAGQDAETIADCWFYFPRMLHAGSQFLIQETADGGFKTISRLEIEKMSEQHTAQRAAA